MSVKNYTDTPGAAGTYCYEIQSKLGNWTSQASNQQTVVVSTLPALVQKTHNEANAATSISATLPASPAANHLLIAIVGAYDNTVINTPSGWSTAINQSGGPSQAIFYKIASGPSDRTVTVTTGTSSALGLRFFEYSGVKTVSPLDQTGSAAGSSASPSSGSVTTTQSVELLVAAATLNATTSTTAWSNSFTLELDGQSTGLKKSDFSAADRIVQATGTYSTTATAGRSGNWRGQIATFKAGP